MTNSFENNTESKFNDCLSCRIWAGTFHIGAAGFVASHWRKQPNRASQAFVIIFSTGKNSIMAKHLKVLILNNLFQDLTN